MPTARYTGGGTYRVGGVSFRPGDEVDVSEDLANYLADVDGFEVDLEVADADEGAADDHDADLEDLTVDELADLAAEAEIEGRSSMNKDELIDALTEA